MIYYCQTDTDVSEITPAAGDTILLKSNEIFSLQSFRSNLFGYSGITLGTYGTGERPIITGGTIRDDWTFDETNNVYSRLYPSNVYLGNVTEDNIPMKFVSWRGTISATLPYMIHTRNGINWSGSMTFDTSTNRLYIKPSSGLASDHEYVVSDVSKILGSGFESNAPTSNVTISGIELRHISTHGILIFNAKNLLIEDFVGRYIGGRFNGYYYGNAIELSTGCFDYTVKNSQAYDIFDSAFSTQLYGSGVGFSSGGLYENLQCERFGMAATEFSVHTANQTVSDIIVNGLHAVDGGVNSWAGGRGGIAFAVVSNSLTAKVTRVYANNVTATRCNKLYDAYNHNGICGMSNSIGIDSFAGTSAGASTASSTTGYTHVDVLYQTSDLAGMWGFNQAIRPPYLSLCPTLN